MPFKRNIERDNLLLGHWRQGNTVKVASLLTGIPEGTISYYYARFNRNKHAYLKPSGNGYQEPPRSNPFDVAAAAFTSAEIVKTVAALLRTGDYARARDYLQAILLFLDLGRRLTPIVQNLDPKKMDEFFQNVITIVKLLGEAGSEKPAPSEVGGSCPS